ncbi:MAG TPA: phosphoribosyltransferase family protein [Candidatus Paceibacterota bacterium]|nr:phosphoribosyltransferase family protein [Candidatus Paceibacterota bacterium]
MNEDDVLRVLQDVGAFRAGHFVFTSGLHSSSYINKDAIYPHVKEVSRLCEAMAQKFKDDNIEAVIGPAYGAIILSTWTAYHLSQMRDTDVWGVYADKVGSDLVIRRGYDKLISGKRTLIVEDLTTTGGSIKKVVDAVHAAGANLVGAIAIANRGGVTKEAAGNPPRFEVVVDLALEQWPEAECVLCQRGIPVNTDVGHGAEFMRKKAVV